MTILCKLTTSGDMMAKFKVICSSCCLTTATVMQPFRPEKDNIILSYENNLL